MSISPAAPMWDGPFTISCDVTPPAEGAAVQWTLNNLAPMEAIETLQVSPTKSLVVGRASDRLEGNWTCVVGYKGGVGRASVALTMKGRVLKTGAGLCFILLDDGCSFSPCAICRNHPASQRPHQSVRCSGVCSHPPLRLLTWFDSLWLSLGEAAAWFSL